MHISLIDPKFRRHGRRYIAQVLVAVSVLLLVLLVERVVTGGLAGGVFIAGIAATAFILFLTPSSVFAAPRHVVGGHLGALAIGAVFAGFLGMELGQQWIAAFPATVELAAVVAVGLSMFAMVISDTEHPPAAATALAVVAHGISWQVAVFLLTSVFLLVVAYGLLRRHLRSLY